MEPNENNENQISRRKKRGRNKLKDPKPRDTDDVEFNIHGQCVNQYQDEFASQCGIYTRTRISINHLSWDKVPKEEKDALWLIIKQHFNLKNDYAKKNTLIACNVAWKKFWTTLRRDFMDKEISPCQKFTSVSAQAWEEFLRREDTSERQAKRIRGRLNAQTQINHPHVGRIGYRGYEKIWDKEKESEHLRTKYHEIQDQLAKNYILARTHLDEQGRRTLLPDVDDVAQQLIQCDKNISQGLQDSGVDPLISELGPEHRGRTRAVASTVGWKKGLEGYAERKKMSEIDKEEMKRMFDELLKEALQEERKNQEAQNLQMHNQYKEEMKNMRAEYTQLIAALQEDVVKLSKGQINPLPIPQINPLPMPQTNPPPVPKQNQRQSNLPRLQDITVPLQVALFDFNGKEFLHDVARGMVHPTKAGEPLHNSPILPWYMKVSIDFVQDKYMSLKVPMPVGEEIVTLGQTIGSFIQWPVPCMRVIKNTVTNPNKTVPRPLPSTDFMRIMKEKEEKKKQEEEKHKQEEQRKQEEEKEKQEEEQRKHEDKKKEEEEEAKKRKWEEEEIERKKKMYIHMVYLGDSLRQRGAALCTGYTNWMLQADPTAPYTIIISPDDDIFGIRDQNVHIIVDARDMVDLWTNNWLDIGVVTWFEWALYQKLSSIAKESVFLDA